MKNVAYNIMKDSITVVLGSDLYEINSTHQNFEAVREAIKDKDFEAIPNLCSLEKAITEFGCGNISVVGGVVYYAGNAVHNTLTDRILQMMEEGFDVTPFVKFMDNLMENPSYRAVNELYGFLEYGKNAITEDGHFLAYKKIQNNWTDIHSGTFDNSIGAVCEMPRNLVDEDSNRTCSAGLHVCSYEYLPHFGWSSDCRVVLVKINPADVVAIPNDYHNTKMRVSRYEVIDEVEDYKAVGDILAEKSVYVTNDDTENDDTNEEMDNLIEKVVGTQHPDKYRGVTKIGERWKAQVQVGSKKVHIGMYPTAREGAKAYNQYVIDNKLDKKLNDL